MKLFVFKKPAADDDAAGNASLKNANTAAVGYNRFGSIDVADCFCVWTDNIKFAPKY